MQPKTVSEALEQFTKTKAAQANPRLVSNLQTALRRYILPNYGFAEAELRSHLDECLAKIPLSQFLGNARQLLETLDTGSNLHSKARKVSRGALNNYRSALQRFLSWMYTQAWDDSTPSSRSGEYAPQMYIGQMLSKTQQKARPHQAEPYALKQEELTHKLEQQLEQLGDFWTKSRVRGRKAKAIALDTFETYRSNILCILGWLHNIQGYSSEQLAIEQVASLEQLQVFIDWGLKQKGNSYGWALNMVQASLSVAKWLDSQKQRNSEISAVKALQDYLHTLRTNYEHEFSQQSQSKAELTLEEGEQIVEYLRQCCAPRDQSGAPRSEAAILKSWQRYLITALLVYSPIRQREISQLEWQRTLFREKNVYRFQSALRSERGRKTLASREFRLPKHLAQDLDTWREQWRDKIPTDHNLVFVRLGSNRTPETIGQPLSIRDISELVSTAIYKATSVLFGTPKQLTPRAFRHTAFAYLEQIGCSRRGYPTRVSQGQIPQWSPPPQRYDTPAAQIAQQMRSPNNPINQPDALLGALTPQPNNPINQPDALLGALTPQPNNPINQPDPLLGALTSPEQTDSNIGSTKHIIEQFQLVEQSEPGDSPKDFSEP
ncbi:site-specific integrase [Cyanobacteria bacterium FACHB-472]|nr:site-specific integrase [Cyanobacteria bacterium FACHB-472]